MGIMELYHLVGSARVSWPVRWDAPRDSWAIAATLLGAADIETAPLWRAIRMMLPVSLETGHPAWVLPYWEKLIQVAKGSALEEAIAEHNELLGFLGLEPSTRLWRTRNHTALTVPRLHGAHKVLHG